MGWLNTIMAFGACAAAALLAPTATAADSAPAPGAALARDALCTTCHDQGWRVPVLAIYQTPHGNRADTRAPSCQTCHGESEAHRNDPGGKHPDVVFAGEAKEVSPAAERNSVCMGCHQTGLRMHWAGSEHESRDIACNSCHKVHIARDPVLAKTTQAEVCFACHKTQRAQIHRVSRHPVLEGKVVCSDCHNPHGSTGPKLLAKNSVNETCYTCHAEKRGPFLWEHSPVVDDCTNCHTPHGSTNPALLKVRAPWLCQQCHSGDHGAAINSGANLPGGNATTVNGMLPLGNQSPRAQTNARACLNCHVQIHGSNHPAGAKFQR